jgi:hypothetical protein
MPDADGFFEEYDGVGEDIIHSTYQFFASNLTVWLNLLDETSWVASALGALPPADVQHWYEEGKAGRKGMGSAELVWPKDVAESLALRLALFRSMAAGTITVRDFAHVFLFGETKFDPMTTTIARQVFRPFHSALRRHLVRLTRQTG